MLYAKFWSYACDGWTRSSSLSSVDRNGLYRAMYRTRRAGAQGRVQYTGSQYELWDDHGRIYASTNKVI